MTIEHETNESTNESVYYSFVNSNKFDYDNIMCPPSAPSPGEVLFNCEDESDIIFMVTMDPAGIEDKWRFPAHSSILQESSPIFETIIQQIGQHRKYNDDHRPTQKPMINIKCRPEIFHMLLSYIYKKEVNMNSIGNCLALLEVSARFALAQLSRLCLSFLYQEANESNVLEMLLQLRRLERPTQPPPPPPLEQFHWDCENLLNELLAKCYHVLDAAAESILRSDSVATLDEPLLLQILERDTLNVNDELTVFECVDRWTVAQCQRYHRPLVAESRRQIAERVLHAVRFLTMDVDTFMLGPFASDLLDEQDKKHLLAKLRQSTYQLPTHLEDEKLAKVRFFVAITFAPDAVAAACDADRKPDEEEMVESVDVPLVGGGKNDKKLRLVVAKRKNSTLKKFLNGLGGVMLFTIRLLD